MITLYSRTLTRAELDRFLDAARATPHFKPTRGGGILNLNRPEIPALPGYRFSPYMDILASHVEPLEESFLERFFPVFDACRPAAVSVMAWLRAAESDRPLPAGYEEGDDQSKIGFGVDEDGPVIRYAPGVTTSGPIGRSRRTGSFNGLFTALGLGDDLEAVVRDDRLRLDVKTDRVYRPPHGDPLVDHRDKAGGRLVSVNGSEPDGANFGEVILNVFAAEDLRAKVAVLVAHVGREKLVGPASVSVRFRPESLDVIRPILNASGFKPWEVQVSVDSGYSLDEIDRAVAEHDSFLIRAFTLRVPKVGELETNLFYSTSGFHLDFSHPSSTPTKHERLTSLIIDIADVAGIPDFLRDLREWVVS